MELGIVQCTERDGDRIVRRIKIVDKMTGEEVENVKCWAWGSAEPLHKPGSDPLFEPEHFDTDDQEGLILFVPCTAMQRL